MLIYPKGPWSGIEDVEFATLTYVDWFNQRRLHGAIEPGPRYTTPAAFEAEWHETNKRATLSAAESPASETGDTNHPSESVAQPALRRPPTRR